jgi:hypothetical protein
MGVDKQGALTLGAIGAVLGATATLASSASYTTLGKFVIGTITGGAVGAVLGGVLPKGRASNPALGAATAVLAGAAMTVAPPTVAAVMAPKFE